MSSRFATESSVTRERVENFSVAACQVELREIFHSSLFLSYFRLHPLFSFARASVVFSHKDACPPVLGGESPFLGHRLLHRRIPLTFDAC